MSIHSDTPSLPITHDQMDQLVNFLNAIGCAIYTEDGRYTIGVYEYCLPSDKAAEQRVRDRVAESPAYALAVMCIGKTEAEVLSTARLKLTLDVEYLKNGVTQEELEEILSSNLQRMIGDGGLTEHTEAEVETYDVSIAFS